jgi:hypothetical protein
VKYRTCRSALGWSVRNAVSLTASSRAIACIWSSLNPSASGTTPAALPVSGSSVNASTSAAV